MTTRVREVRDVRTNSLGMQLTWCPPGEFDMGRSLSVCGSRLFGRDPSMRVFSTNSYETPHQVTLTMPFFLGTHAVTQKQYKRVMGVNPSYFKGPKSPVESISYEDAEEFCRRLSALPAEIEAGLTYRLPTEAEWEYACRAGTKTAYSFGNSESDLEDYGWFAANSGDLRAALSSVRQSEVFSGFNCVLVEDFDRIAKQPNGKRPYTKTLSPSPFSFSVGIRTTTFVAQIPEDYDERYDVDYNQWDDEDDFDEEAVGGFGEKADSPHHSCRTHAVGLKKPNPWGLFDMHGNVWEWCQDFAEWYGFETVVDPVNDTPNESAARVCRGGGSLATDPRHCWSSHRRFHNSKCKSLGFRVAVTAS